jgi:hypothetical protein
LVTGGWRDCRSGAPFTDPPPPDRAAVLMPATAETISFGARMGMRYPAIQAPQATDILDSFQFVSGISLELLEKTVFPFASRDALEYLMGTASHTGPPF